MKSRERLPKVWRGVATVVNHEERENGSTLFAWRTSNASRTSEALRFEPRTNGQDRE